MGQNERVLVWKIAPTTGAGGLSGKVAPASEFLPEASLEKIVDPQQRCPYRGLVRKGYFLKIVSGNILIYFRQGVDWKRGSSVKVVPMGVRPQSPG